MNELISRATIVFPQGRDKSDIQFILENIAQQVGGGVEYTFGQTYKAGYQERAHTFSPSALRALSVRGEIIPGARYIEQGSVLFPFESICLLSRGHTLIDGLRFKTPVGYGIHEVPSSDLAFYDLVRKGHGIALENMKADVLFC